MSTIVTLTDSAKEHMTTMLKENSKKAVRPALKGGGCAGFKYDWFLRIRLSTMMKLLILKKESLL